VSEQGFSRWNSYFYPGTDTLVNKLGIRNAEALKGFEYTAALQRSGEIRSAGITGGGDLSHLMAVHRHLFQDTYEWAGQLRDVSMAKGASTSFEKPENIVAVAEQVHARLVQADYLKGTNKVQFVDHLSRYYADLNRLHPFREGNGRAMRIVLRDIADRAGYTLDQSRIANDKGQWNAAAAKSMVGDIDDVRKILSEAIRPSRAIALERLPRDEALAAFPELETVYALLDTASHRLEQQYPGNAKAQLHFMAHKRSEIVRQLDAGDERLLGPPEPMIAIPERFAAAWTKAQAFAQQQISDPKMRVQFLAQFEKRMQEVDRRKPPPTRQPERTLAR
jgi:cell filamentation protein